MNIKLGKLNLGSNIQASNTVLAAPPVTYLKNYFEICEAQFLKEKK